MLSCRVAGLQPDGLHLVRFVKRQLLLSINNCD